MTLIVGTSVIGVMVRLFGLKNEPPLDLGICLVDLLQAYCCFQVI